jgi:hypothetical protein
MAIHPDTPRYDMPLTDVDEASRIMLECLNSALIQMAAKKLDKAAALCGAMQMTMRLYADHLDDDEEAIRQVRTFLNDWERDVLALGESPVH